MNQSHLFSFNENYKASITEASLEEEKKYEVCVYRWSEELLDDDGKNIWERKAGPFISDTPEEAKTIAQAQLALFTGEKPQEIKDPTTQALLQKHLSEEYQSFDPKGFDVFLLDREGQKDTPLQIQTLIATPSLYLVQSESHWYIGYLAEDQEIHCFQAEEKLEEVLKKIKEDA